MGEAHNGRCNKPFNKPKEPLLFDTENDALSHGINQTGKYYGTKPGLPDIKDHIHTATGTAGKALFALFSYYTDQGTKYYITIL